MDQPFVGRHFKEMVEHEQDEFRLDIGADISPFLGLLEIPEGELEIFLLFVPVKSDKTDLEIGIEIGL